MNAKALETNLTLYPWYQAAAGFLPWMPVFFLFFFEHVSLPQALQLGAVYYFSVFVFEVPSGYLSDRLGRKLTLLLSSSFAFFSYLIFILSSDFAGLALGQIVLAAVFSFKSGSDNSLLYDTLSSLGRESEYANREAAANRFGKLALAAAAILGGATGVIDLKIPYYLSALGAIASILICYNFVEPVTDKSAAPFFKQLGICFNRLKHPHLLWLFGFFVFAYSLLHVPAEFNQPYVKLLNIDWFLNADTSPLISGLMVMISMLGGAFGATISMPLLRRLGIRKLLLASLAIMVVIIAGMASILHPAVLVLVLFRNFPMAVAEAPMLSAISPHIQSHYRATYLSIQSLTGRLVFSIALLSLSTVVDSDEKTQHLSWLNLQSALVMSLVAGLVCFSVLLFFRNKVQD